MNYNMRLPDNTTIGSIYSYDYEFDPKFGWPNYRKNMKHGILTENFGYENLRLDSIWGNSNANNGFGYENSGNITRKNDLGLMEYDGYQVTDLYAKEANFVPTDQQDINYTWFQQVRDISEGDYAATFTYNSDQQRCKMVVSQNGSTLYTRWYPGSRYMKEEKGSTTTQYSWLGGDAYSAPAVSVKVGTATPVIYYVLRDHLGSITHAVKASDLTYKEYSFDAWGRRRSANDWNYTLDTNDKELFAGRGFTGHEHLIEFGLINMNGRLYDPLLGRFLSPDNYVQMPDFSQNFNRYSYALNNPLVYTDPDGEIIFTIIGALLAPVTGGASLPIGIAADIGSVINVASNWNNIDNFGEGLGYYGVGAVSGAVSQIPGAGIPLSGFISGAGNEFLNTNILTDDVSWSDLDGNDAGRILLSGGIGAASSYYGAKWGGQFSDKAINGLNVESMFMKNTIEKTSQGFTGGYINGFFNEAMLGSGDVKTAFKSGLVQGGWGAAFGFTFSSVEYGLNRSGVEQYWTKKELSIKIKSPYDDYYEYNFKYENGTQPNSPYYQYNPRTTPSNMPGNNWQVPMRAPTSPPRNFNLWKIIYPELYY